MKNAMMFKSKMILLTRDNLRDTAIDVKIEDLHYIDFLIDDSDVRNSHIIMFVDKNGETKLIKNRWGNTGIIR